MRESSGRLVGRGRTGVCLLVIVGVGIVRAHVCMAMA